MFVSYEIIGAALAGAAVTGVVSIVIKSNKKGHGSLPDIKDTKLLEFLNKASEAYIQSFTERQMKYLSKYVSDEVIRELLPTLKQDDILFIGTPKYRETVFTIIVDDNSTLKVKRELHHKNVELKRGIKMALGDDLTEIWEILRVSSEEFKIVSILAI